MLVTRKLKKFVDVNEMEIPLFHRKQQKIFMTAREGGVAIDISKYKGAMFNLKGLPEDESTMGAWVGKILDDGSPQKRGHFEAVLSMKSKALAKEFSKSSLVIAFIEVMLTDETGTAEDPTYYPVKIYDKENKK